ncbi:cellulose synthase family protein [Bacteroidota bacterium]
MIYIILIGFYMLAMLLVVIFSLGQLNLAVYYLKSRNNRNNSKDVRTLKTFPFVTVQLPVYNEKYVIERLIDSVTAIDYPSDRIEIQVLDDSTDETVEIITRKVSEYSKSGLNITHLHRDDRSGFKAGALQLGLQEARGEYIVIFDADFIPDPKFLKSTLPAFKNAQIGMVQTRWGHINEDFSTFTRLQAFGLNAHFSVEQSGRSCAGSCINFNGTAGIWRKSCIEDAGGWHLDTLSEDLDLSYRAQLKGWKFKYLEDVVSPAELPVVLSAIKSQQYRWNKGAAETARKNLWNVLRSSLKGINKAHAVFHLLNSSFIPFLFFAAFMSVPMLFIKSDNPQFNVIFNISSIFIIGFIGIAIFYWVSFRYSHKSGSKFDFIKEFFLYIAFFLGLSMHNTIAVLEGWMGIKTPFVRTPKFDIQSNADSISANSYIKQKINWEVILEGMLLIYFVFGIGAGIYLHDYGLIPFHILLAMGFAAVFIYSLLPVKFYTHASPAE